MKRPMKGDQIEDLSKVRLPVYAFPKIDGFRCVLSHRPLTSRLSPFPNVHFDRELSKLLREPLLDSEAVVGSRRGEGVLGRTSSGLTSKDGEPDFHLWCFDTPQLGYRFEDRLKLTKQIIRDIDHPRIHFLKPKLIESLDELEEYLEVRLAMGYEGIILRCPNGPYKFGKSTLREQWMLKVKPFEDFEARIKGYFEEEENTNEAKREATGKLKRSSAKAGKKPKGTLGGFIGDELDSKGKPTGVEVRVGGGFTAAQRKAFWAIRDELVAAGAIMKCKKQKIGQKDKPRHPGFISLRPEWDLG